MSNPILQPNTGSVDTNPPGNPTVGSNPAMTPTAETKDPGEMSADNLDMEAVLAYLQKRGLQNTASLLKKEMSKDGGEASHVSWPYEFHDMCE